ncbi:L,D-transpeptidase family protein [Flavobacterium undicola]|uniref:L,D-transpeptidase family protein n=1 Tax=Flavobacterium undicola TaxID=1932779 RepID=UPI00137710BB|nr:L,D-transpeptidase family protein [Flavobacterium undicola]MBA0882311.1 L,D-transpeptidase family protein [Flavobacterium undicola]
MRKFVLYIVVILFGFSLTSVSLIKKENLKATVSYFAPFSQKSEESESKIPINKQNINTFFKKYPNLKPYESEVSTLYENRKYNAIWYDATDKLIEFSQLLYSKVNSLQEEGVEARMEYQEIIDGIFDSNATLKPLSKTETEIMLSSLYVFYVQKVFIGISAEKLQQMGWFLPKKKIAYQPFLDSLLQNPKLLNFDEKHQLGQYYKLRDALKKYREIEKTGEWKPIEYDSTIPYYKPFDNSKTISQIRHRLVVIGDLDKDSKSAVYDDELMKGILRFKKRNGYLINYFISPWQIKQMNLPIQKYIRKIMINMERCRWIDPELTNASEYIIINIPSYKLIYKKNGKTVLESNVIVGQDMMETVIFSGFISSIVFSPYWNVPQSIIDNEIKYAMERDKDYLNSRNMEWNDGKVRQKPGPKNALGLVKFVFPNTNSIYLHDTPAKAIFALEYRAYSHGCINMEKAKELAFLILKDDPDWPVARITEAMNGEKETTCELKNKIPIHISYFTTWVDSQDVLHFYEDVYGRDPQFDYIIFKH